jgi:FKBP-type peptidyl-prolyl cis-trans isomerase
VWWCCFCWRWSAAGPPSLQIEDLKEGTGPGVKKGDTVHVHYVGWFKSGKKFDSSHDHDPDEPLKLTVGRREVIKGWEEGLIGMKVGGKRKLIIPPDLAYGEEGRPPVIPPNAELTFELELVKIGNY